MKATIKPMPKHDYYRKRGKAILVIDMPNDCWECPMHVDGLDDENEEIMVCNAEKIESHYGEKPSWCPLKPMPLKRKTEVVWHDDNGRELITHEYTEKDKVWNEIVDYLEGENYE